MTEKLENRTLAAAMVLKSQNTSQLETKDGVKCQNEMETNLSQVKEMKMNVVNEMNEMTGMIETLKWMMMFRVK